MIEITSFHRALTRFLLIGSGVVFAVGATVPALEGFWGMSLEDGARWIAANPNKWAFSSVLFITSLILCSNGLAIFNEYFQFGEARLLAKIGFITFLIGSLFWIMDMGFRLSTESWAAQIFVETSSAPDSFTPLRLLQSTFFDIFMISTFLASSIYGFALLKSQQSSKVLGWFAVGYGLFGAIAHAIPGGPIPGMVLVVPLALGLSPYPNPAQHEQQPSPEKP